MCAQCAFVALAAIGTYSAFHNQIRARVDKALGIDDAVVSNIAPASTETLEHSSEPLTPERSVTLAVFLLVLSQLRHRAEPTPVESPPLVVSWEGELASGVSAAGD